MCPGPFHPPLVRFQIFRSSFSCVSSPLTILQVFCSWFDQIILQDWPPQSRSPSPLNHPDAKPQSASIPQKSIDHPGFFPGKKTGCLKIREWVYSASSGQRSQAPDPALPQKNDSDPWCIDKEFNAVLTNQFWAQLTNPIVFQPSCVQKKAFLKQVASIYTPILIKCDHISFPLKQNWIMNCKKHLLQELNVIILNMWMIWSATYFPPPL